MQRDPERHPAGHRPLGAPGVLRGRRRLRRDQHLRLQPFGGGRVRHRRPDLRAVRGRRPDRPRGRRRVRRPGRPPALGARLDRPRHQAAVARPHRVRRPARRLPAERRGPARRRRRRPDRRDHPGPAADQGQPHRRPPRDGSRRARRTPDLFARLRDHGRHAARLRDRRGADRPRAPRHRPDRPELLHRPGRDERAPALPRPPLPYAAHVHAERRPAHPDQGRRLLPAHGARDGRRAGELRPRLRPLAGRRLLRLDPRAPAPGRRTRPGPHPRRARPAPGARRRLALPDRAVPPGHRVHGNRRAHERQRLEEVPRGHARRPLGRLRRDGPRPDPRGRAHARPVCRLRGPRRRRRHGGARRPLRDRLHAAHRPGLHRGGRPAGRPGEARRPGRHQLRQLRGRRRPRVPLRQGHPPGPGARRRAHRPHHRRGGPGPDRRAQGGHRRAAHRGPHRQLGHPRVRHPHRHPDLHDLHRPGGVAEGRHRHHRGDPRAEAPPPGRPDHARPLQHLLRSEPGRPHPPQLRLPRRVRQGGPGLGDRPRLEDPAHRPFRRRAGHHRPRPDLRPALRGLRPAAEADGPVRGRQHQVDEGRQDRGAPRPAAGRAAEAPDRRRREERSGGRPRRGADAPARAGDRQRDPARRHEDRGRAVRLRPDAAAVRAAVRRGHEDGRRLPRTAHGEVGPTTATTSSTSASSSRSPRSSKPPRSTAPTSSACPVSS